MSYQPTLMQPVTRVFGKSGIWGGSLCIYEFQHTGPSRSGEATISVVIMPNDCDDEPIVHIVYAHHEGVQTESLQEWSSNLTGHWEACKDESEYAMQDYLDMKAMDGYIKQAIAEYKKI